MNNKNKTRSIIIVLIIILIVGLCSIIVYNVAVPSKTEVAKEELIKLKDIKTKEDFLKYLNQNNKEENVTYKVDSDDEEFIRAIEYKDKEETAIILFDKKIKEIVKEKIEVNKSGYQGE